MNLINKMERKFGRYAIPNLARYIAILYAVGFFIKVVMPEFYFQYLCLDARAILHGQIWRIFTFIIWPPLETFFGVGSFPLILMFNALLIRTYYSIGNVLEQVMGSFRFNLYIFLGFLGHALAAVIVYLITGRVYILTTDYLNLSLVLLFAVVFPNVRFRLNFVIPIEAKWLAVFDGAFLLYEFAFGSMPVRISIAMSFLNFMVYALMIQGSRLNPKEIQRKQKFKSQMREAEAAAKTLGRHRCAVCGRTEEDDPELVFRYCSKCEGDYEYCQDHLYTHQHVIRKGMDPRQQRQ